MINKPNSRKAGGYSLRESLIRQGVTTTEGMSRHLSFVSGTLKGNPHLDITRYRVNADRPNELPRMG
jgi:hypothetical protein